MTPNASYVCRYTLRLTNCDDVRVELEARRTYHARAFDLLIDSETGEVMKLPIHVARNPTWYFEKVGEFNPRKPELTQAEYVAAIVRGNPGLDAGALYDVMKGEGFAPYAASRPPTAQREIPYSGFSTLLSKDPGIEQRLDGVPVKGTAAERGRVHGCTYHVKVKVRATDGWAV